jgi:hypothetical protein
MTLLIHIAREFTHNVLISDGNAVVVKSLVDTNVIYNQNFSTVAGLADGVLRGGVGVVLVCLGLATGRIGLWHLHATVFDSAGAPVGGETARQHHHRLQSATTGDRSVGGWEVMS